jgi:hypothetical protein
LACKEILDRASALDIRSKQHEDGENYIATGLRICAFEGDEIK